MNTPQPRPRPALLTVLRGRLAGARHEGDRGIALLMTVIVMFIVVILITVVFNEGIQTLPLASGAQNYQNALQAAEAGVQDYINRLDTNSTYYTQTADSTNPALAPSSGKWTSWAALPGGSVTNEWFRYAVNSVKTAQTGIVYLTVTGAAGQNPTNSGARYAARTIKVGISLSGFTSFLYFTDYEVDDPAIVSSFSGPGRETYTQDCLFHAWQYNTYTHGYGPDPNYCTGYAIDFVPSDTLDGPVFSNDEFRICGAASFPEGATSAYDQGTGASSGSGAGSTSYGNAGTYIDPAGCTGTPTFGGAGTQPAGGADEPFPATNTSLENDLATSNQGGGCAYTGPVVIQFNTSGTTGTMTVTLPTGSSASPASCAGTKANTATTVSLPPNGLIYDENPSGCASSSCEADVYVSGTVTGQVTVGSQNNITISGNLLDSGGVSGSNIIGLTATNYIVLPDSNSTNPVTGKALSTVSGLQIDAAMVALNHSMWLPGWSSDSTLGSLQITGSIAQEYRGPVGAHNGNTLTNGYGKDYVYDSRLKYEQPPYFTSPTLPTWSQASFAECAATATPATSTC
jgi:Tfp pilus assembly protein PilX